MSEKEIWKMIKKNNVILFSDYFMKKRIIEEGKLYYNEIVGECNDCSGIGITLVDNDELICISCEGTGIVYYGKENINCNCK